jgi:vacuolar-type H+-ATPase subunit H
MGGLVEKLERVLVAEENARQTVARAVDEAAALRLAAREEAARIERESAEASRRTVDALRDEVLSAVRAESDRLLAQAEADRAAALSLAQGRVESVVTRLTSIVEG